MAAAFINFVKVCILVLVSLVAFNVCLGAEHTEGSSMRFYYEPTQKYFVAATRQNCYFVRITTRESEHAHTNQGMEDLEIKMIHDWLGKLNETLVSHNDPGLPHYIQHWCTNQDIYLLDRVLPVDPSASSTPFVNGK